MGEGTDQQFDSSPQPLPDIFRATIPPENRLKEELFDEDHLSFNPGHSLSLYQRGWIKDRDVFEFEQPETRKAAATTVRIIRLDINQLVSDPEFQQNGERQTDILAALQQEVPNVDLTMLSFYKADIETAEAVTEPTERDIKNLVNLKNAMKGIISRLEKSKMRTHSASRFMNESKRLIPMIEHNPEYAGVKAVVESNMKALAELDTV